MTLLPKSPDMTKELFNLVAFFNTLYACLMSGDEILKNEEHFKALCSLTSEALKAVKRDVQTSEENASCGRYDRECADALLNYDRALFDLPKLPDVEYDQVNSFFKALWRLAGSLQEMFSEIDVMNTHDSDAQCQYRGFDQERAQNTLDNGFRSIHSAIDKTRTMLHKAELQFSTAAEMFE
jgi:hypothetical protein